jgi:hypothetical protein
VIAAELPPPPLPAPIVAGVKTVYPRTPIRVTRICVVERWALVRIRVKGHESFVLLEHVAKRWKARWVDGAILRSVPPARRPAVAAEADRVKTRCLAP